MEIRSPYSKRQRISLSAFEPTKAKQQFKAETDINNILRKYQQTGILPTLNNAQAHYGDFSTVQDYQSAMNSVMSANMAFEALPSTVRARFGNDPAQLISFVSDSSNKDEAIRLGLIEKPHTEAPTASEPAASAATTEKVK